MIGILHELSALTDGDPFVRISAVRELAAIDDPEAVRLIVKMADDSDWVVRGCAAWALGRPGCVEAFPTLERLADDVHPFVRFRAIAALGEIQGRAMLLRIAADEQRDRRERIRAIHAMRRIDDPEIEPFLRRMGEDAPDGGVATIAVVVLIDRGVGEVEEGIRRILTADGWWDKVQVIRLLHRLGSQAVSLLRMAFEDSDWRVRASTLEELGRIDEDETVELIISKQVLSDPDPRVRAIAARVLKRIHNGCLYELNKSS